MYLCWILRTIDICKVTLLPVTLGQYALPSSNLDRVASPQLI